MKPTALLQFVAAVLVLEYAQAFELFRYTKRDVSHQFTIGPGDLTHAWLGMDDEKNNVVGYVLELNGSVLVLVQTAVQYLEWQSIGFPDARVNMSGVNACSCLERQLQVCFLNCTLEDRDNYISLINMESESVQVEISFSNVKESMRTPSSFVNPTANSTVDNSTASTTTRKRCKHRKPKCDEPKQAKALLPSINYPQMINPISIAALLPDNTQQTNIDYTSSLEPPLPSPSDEGYNPFYPSIDVTSSDELPFPPYLTVPSRTTDIDPFLQNRTYYPATNESPFTDIQVSPTVSPPEPPLATMDPNLLETISAKTYSTNSIYSCSIWP